MSASAYADWSAALASTRLGIGPAELHGSMTGYLCADWCRDSRRLLVALALESDDAGVPDALRRLLDGATTRLARELRSGEAVVPLLPSGSLQVRADALVEWCRGFLGGLGLTGAVHESTPVPEVADVLDGFARIAAAPLACDDGDEVALADVLDFVSAGVHALHRALAPTGRR